ncbi:Endonuclease 8 1 [Porphyridium purpureum]|uniref:DNA-(apurinic or apyrimidinic site) lyase n=1 Tax=Porphyridium purpureum TaxID=35688 RepID=A0A5J4YWY3_PORPP|nr:Endonuclease 8 1 [Porphyridium purpureum]|eukprot:POR6976..scf227_4
MRAPTGSVLGAESESGSTRRLCWVLAPVPPSLFTCDARRRAPSATSGAHCNRGFRISMVEGHQTQRLAARHRRTLLGLKFDASSPNGRFTEGAKLIHGQTLHQIEAHGKNLFYFFGGAGPVQRLPCAPVPVAGASEASAGIADNCTVVHVHFGMSGQFKTMKPPGAAPTPTTRLRLVHENNLVAHVSAMTLNHGPLEYYWSKVRKLGPDPLREDADVDTVWRKVSESKKSIGLLLMDQSVVAGIGNIYRAEILFKAGVHPDRPGRELSRDEFDRVWAHSVLLLQRGFMSGSILTVDPAEAQRLGAPWTRRYIYNHSTCGRCRGAIRTWDIATRTAYACEVCQPLHGASQKLNAVIADPTTLFKSHCAPEGPALRETLQVMTVTGLKDRLRALGMPLHGRKEELVDRLVAAIDSPLLAVASAGEMAAFGKVRPGFLHLLGSEATEAMLGEEHDDLASEPSLRASDDEQDEVLPGVAQMDMQSAQAAALEKERAGESRAVEHVALLEVDDALENLASRPTAKRRRGIQGPKAADRAPAGTGTGALDLRARKPRRGAAGRRETQAK